MPTSNDHQPLTPRTSLQGPVLSFDFPGLLIGAAEYDEGPTGCTVFHFPAGAATAVDVRGGWVGMTDAFEWSDAVCLAGGSQMGLEAVSGVAAGIFAQRGYEHARQPVVNGAIIFDFGRRANTIYPDRALGRAALEAAQPGVFPLGRQGAGRMAHAGSVFGRERGEPAGQGGAFREVAGVKLAVFTVVNALGVVVDRQGKVVRGNRDPATGQRPDLLATLEERLAAGPPVQPLAGNTTLTLVVTNQKLEQRLLTQLARQVHSSMARAIRPFHTEWDGDVLYAVTTATVETGLGLASLALLASELAWDAVLAAVGDEGGRARSADDADRRR